MCHPRITYKRPRVRGMTRGVHIRVRWVPTITNKKDKRPPNLLTSLNGFQCLDRSPDPLNAITESPETRSETLSLNRDGRCRALRESRTETVTGPLVNFGGVRTLLPQIKISGLWSHDPGRLVDRSAGTPVPKVDSTEIPKRHYFDSDRRPRTSPRR